MLRGSDASDAEAEARQLALGPPNELAVLAALSDADIIDVSGAEPIFDLLDINGDGRLSAEELRQGVRSDAVVHYVRETGNAILKGLLRDRRGVGRALQEIDDSSGPFVSRRGWKRFVEAMAVERVRHLREMGLVKGRCYWGKGLDDVQTTPSLLKWFSPLALRGNHSVGRPKFDSHTQVPARLLGGLLVLRAEQPPGPLLSQGPGPPLWEKRGARGRARPAGLRDLGGGCRGKS